MDKSKGRADQTVIEKCSVIAIVMRHIKTRPAAVRALKHAFSLRTCLRTYLRTYVVRTVVANLKPYFLMETRLETSSMETGSYSFRRKRCKTYRLMVAAQK